MDISKRIPTGETATYLLLSILSSSDFYKKHKTEHLTDTTTHLYNPHVKVQAYFKVQKQQIPHPPSKNILQGNVLSKPCSSRL